MGDYVRQMPDGSADLARPPSAASRFHLDLPLLLLLMILTAYGLVVLYSASGQDMAKLVRRLSILPVSIAICPNIHWLDHLGGAWRVLPPRRRSDGRARAADRGAGSRHRRVLPELPDLRRRLPALRHRAGKADRARG